MNIASLLVLVHVLTAFWFVAGLVGRVDRAVAAARAYEAGSVFVVITLMVTKPF
jgi:cytochrome b subunit of formate dehydrogenase